MPDATPRADGADSERRAERGRERRQRLDDVFGDALPSQTRDDAPEGEETGRGSRDEWYRREVPPHHA